MGKLESRDIRGRFPISTNHGAVDSIAYYVPAKHKYFSQSMRQRQWVDTSVPAPHQYGKSGEIDLGMTINQDFAA